MSTNLKYRPEIDGLRTVAVLAVILFHAEFQRGSEHLFLGGFVGVDVFFVISGYLITAILLKGLAQGTFSFKDFYERRARRILPILFTVMLVTIPFAWVYLLPKAMIDYANSIIYSLFFSSNIWFWLEDSYWAEPSALKPFLHTWSLAVEEQFYIVTPFLLLLLWKYAKDHMLTVFVAISLISLHLAYRFTPEYAEFTFFMLPARMWELSAGTILAVAERKYSRKNPEWMTMIFPAIGVYLICYSILTFDETTPHPSFITLLPIIGTMLIIWFSAKGEFVTKILSSKIFVGIGLISYGLYLWHFPIFAFARVNETAPSNIDKLWWIVLSLVLSLLTYYLIEKPFRNKQLISTKTLIISLGTAFSIILIATSLGVKDGFKSRFPAFLAQDQQHEKVPNHVWVEPSNNASTAERILVAGDSHMQAIDHAIRAQSLEQGYAYAQSSFNACQLIINLDRVNKKTGKKHKFCVKKANDKRMKFILDSAPSFVVLGGRLPMILEEDRFNNQEGGDEGDMGDIFQYPDKPLLTREIRNAAIAKEYANTVQRILKAGHKVVLVYPIPEVGWDVPKTLHKLIDRNYHEAASIMRDKPITTSYEVFQSRTKSAYQLLDSIKHKDIYRVYPEKLFCNGSLPGRCISHDDNSVFYKDDDHLSLAGAELLAAQVLKTIMADRPN